MYFIVFALSLLAGLVIGALVTLWRGERARRRAEEFAGRPELPEGVPAVLAVMRLAAVVVDVADGVVKASPASYAFGIVRAGRIAHDPLVDLVRQVRGDGVIREREFELPRGPIGPGKLTVHARVAPLGALHVILLIEDRTEAKRLESARRDFVVNISHELKTPVGAISLLAETVEDAADDPDAVRRFSSRMQSEAERLSQLVKEVIDLSRLQVSQGIDQPSFVAIDDVVNEAIDRSRTTASARDIGLHRGPAVDAGVYGDRELLVTAVRNLVDNAIRYSDAGTRVGIGVKADEDVIEVAVADQGIGIPTKDLQRVFERFYRVDEARSRETGGTGLGLSIVKHVALNHGGEVRVWSRPGQGSTFTLRIPLATAEDDRDRFHEELTT